MINDSLGYKQATITRKLRSETYIDIFLIGKKCLVKQTDSLEQLLAVEGGRCASAKYVSRRIKMIRVSTREPPLIGYAKPTKFVPSTVDARGIGKKQNL
jgi:hypothetical protein